MFAVFLCYLCISLVMSLFLSLCSSFVLSVFIYVLLRSACSYLFIVELFIYFVTSLLCVVVFCFLYFVMSVCMSVFSFSYFIRPFYSHLFICLVRSFRAWFLSLCSSFFRSVVRDFFL